MQVSALPIDGTASEVSESLMYIHPLPAKKEKHSAMKTMLSLHVKTNQANKLTNQPKYKCQNI